MSAMLMHGFFLYIEKRMLLLFPILQEAGFLIQIMQELELIKAVKGKGKGKYRFLI